MTIAPTGTISIIAGASSGIEPLFALSYVRNVMDNTRLVEGNTYFEAVARHEGFYSPELMEQLAASGSLDDLAVPGWVKDVFRVSHDINPQWHVKMQAAFQTYTDNAVSKTINFPHDATVDDVAEAYRAAYELGCKGITVYRDGSKSDQVLSTGTTTGTQSGESADVRTIEVPGPRVPRERPRRTQGITERVRTGHGNMYVTVNLDEKQPALRGVRYDGQGRGLRRSVAGGGIPANFTGVAGRYRDRGGDPPIAGDHLLSGLGRRHAGTFGPGRGGDSPGADNPGERDGAGGARRGAIDPAFGYARLRRRRSGSAPLDAAPTDAGRFISRRVRQRQREW